MYYQHISCCYSVINKKVDLNQLDRRKENVLNIAQTVDGMDVISVDDPLICDIEIPFHFDSDSIISTINQSGDFISIRTVPTPMLESVSVLNPKGDVNVQWKLENSNDKIRSKIKKLRVEWNGDDSKEDWIGSKVIEVTNVQNDGNQLNIGSIAFGDYVLRTQCMINDKLSSYSNIKTLSIKGVQANFKWTHKTQDYATISSDGMRVTIDKRGGYSWTGIASSTGWNSGKYFWRIKLNKRGSSWDGVGVVTDYEKVVSDGYVLSQPGSVMIYCGSSVCKTGKNLGSVTKWNPGDIMTLRLDCDSWKLTFQLNNTDLMTVDLDRNKTYYPAIQVRSDVGYDLQLLP